MKSSQNNRKLLVTTILFTLYWRGINTDDNSSSDISENIVRQSEIKQLQSKFSRASNLDEENNENDNEDKTKVQKHSQKKSRDEIEPRKSRQENNKNTYETTRSSNRTVQANNYAFIRTRKPDEDIETSHNVFPTDGMNSEELKETTTTSKPKIPVQYYNHIPNRRHKEEDDDIVRPRKTFSKDGNNRKQSSEERRTTRHKRFSLSYPELSRPELSGGNKKRPSRGHFVPTEDFNQNAKSRKTTKKYRKPPHSRTIQPQLDQASKSIRLQPKEATTPSVLKESMSYEDIQKFYRTVMQQDKFVTTQEHNILNAKTIKKHIKDYPNRYSKIVRPGQNSKDGTDIKIDKGKAHKVMNTFKLSEDHEYIQRSTNSQKKIHRMPSTTAPGQNSKEGSDIKIDKGKAHKAMNTFKLSEDLEYIQRSTNSQKKLHRMSSSNAPGQNSKDSTDIKIDKGKAHKAMNTFKSSEDHEYIQRSTHSLKKLHRMSSSTAFMAEKDNEDLIKGEEPIVQETAFIPFSESSPINVQRMESTTRSLKVTQTKSTNPSTLSTTKSIFYRDSEVSRPVTADAWTSQNPENTHSSVKPEHKSTDSSHKKKRVKTSRGKKPLRQKGDSDSYKEPLRSTRLFVEEEDLTEPPVEEKTSPRVEMLSPYSIVIQLKRLADYYNDNNIANVTVEVIGRTVEYNNIVLLKITECAKDVGFRAGDSKFVDEKPEKKIIFIVHGLTVAGMRHLIKNEDDLNMVMEYYLEHLDKFDFYVIPIANPDGLAANSNSQAEGYWNKNMSPQGSCAGVVLDRNFDIAWNMTHGISSCSHLYPGPAAFSEAETTAIRDVMHLNSHRIEAFIHVHASTYKSSIFKGDAVLYPQGYTDFPVDDDKYIDLKAEVEEAMKNASFKVISVTVESLYNWYGKVSGSSVDYASTVYGIPFAMEFSMQLYENHQKDAFEKIWKKIINTAIMNIWKGQQSQGENNYN